ncbi:MAG: hemerythrin domain-containing protein [Gemmatimonadota bacterium]
MVADRTATETLRREHRLIVRVAASLERLIEQTTPPLDALVDCITFFRLFTDACHHRKEEDHLFAALEEWGLARDSGPVAVMLEEHRAGRELVERMSVALSAVRAGKPAGSADFKEAARDYIRLIRQHIAKEDDALFEMADDLIGGPACARLCDHYEDVCRRRFEGRTVRDLERLAERIVERAGGE